MGILTKTKKGEVTNFFGIVIFIFVAAVIWQVFLFNQKATNIKEDIDTTLNQYILCLEADGYLSDGNKLALINDLASFGVTGIDLTGTDLSNNPKSYGERVTLQVHGTVKIPTFQLSWLRLVKTTIPAEVNEKRTSVSHGVGLIKGV